jgi:MarR family 2-MHQ and catechol resistance regulon transcriptional repressor
LHDLGELLLVSRANITGLIDHLEQKELVTRSVDLADRRARFAKITPSGQALLEQLIPAHNETVQLLLQEMTGDEKQMLIKLLKKARLSLAANRANCSAKLPARMKTNKD